MKTISVPLNKKTNRSYQIVFGSSVRDFPTQLKLKLGGHGKLFLLTTRAISRTPYLKEIHKALVKKGFDTHVEIIPNGEKEKNISRLAHLYKQCLKTGIDRKSVVVGLGGGVVTDLAGFLAATYMRGLSFVSIPTTLLGMVDASIGGKTGIDLKEGKNLVGAFWQPRLVWVDVGLLKTLPRKEWVTGFAEVIKYGVIKDARFFQWLEEKVRHQPEIRKWPAKDLIYAISVSAQIKAEVVGSDERETPQKGGREILNFGHTIGHALEAATSYQALTHGEAVSIGMAAAGLIARQMGMWSDDDQLQLLSTLQVMGLPIHIPARVKVSSDRFWKAIKKDKKNVGGQMRFVVPRRLGKVEVISGIPERMVRQVMSVAGL
jgi:3-dehydroquinate synthase